MAGLTDHSYRGPHTLRAINCTTDERVILEADVNGIFEVPSGRWRFETETLAEIVAADGRIRVVPRRRRG